MASPLKSAKQTVNLASGEVRVSRIRRDPPPQKLKQISIEERNERDQRNAIIGITVFTMALMVIILAVASWAGWTPRAYHIFM
ncbi:hypothetical protein LZ518_08660 [Sphingomonas sp. RB56-2]|uniref:Uncharacterized protein n=1 Tax=Sphingomonas brevis TaxID=2908206 RepID=A0ABT0SAP4_9SPHN|nr:hypothetical protein [Sphingomonas brevis]MCL6741200.1 hypothetical protein [Sphingomonas brevis]